MKIDAECYSAGSLTFLQLFLCCKRVEDNDPIPIFYITEIDTEYHETSYTLIREFFAETGSKITPRVKKVAINFIVEMDMQNYMKR